MQISTILSLLTFFLMAFTNLTAEETFKSKLDEPEKSEYKNSTIVGLNFQITNNSEEDLYFYWCEYTANGTWSLKEINGKEKYKIIYSDSTDTLVNTMKWFGCNKIKDCGLNSIYIIASHDQIEQNLTFLENRNIDCNKKPSSKGSVLESSSFEDDIGNGISIYSYEFELTP